MKIAQILGLILKRAYLRASIKIRLTHEEEKSFNELMLVLKEIDDLSEGSLKMTILGDPGLDFDDLCKTIKKSAEEILRSIKTRPYSVKYPKYKT